MNLKLDELTKEELQKIIEKIAKRLSKEQYEYLQHLITECTEKENTADISPQSLMAQGFVDEKMLQIEEWKQQIEDGKLYLDTEEYEDYGDDYWDREWIIEYYDNQQIGDKIMFMMRFANDCINDRRYQEANSIYESGKIHMIKERSKELGITPEEYIYSDHIKEVEERFDCKILRKSYMLKYKCFFFFFLRKRK